MNILEKDIEDLVYEAALIKPHILSEKGLDIISFSENVGTPTILRQFQLGNYGVMDLVIISYDVMDDEFIIDILELKKDAVDYSTLDQGIRYKKGISEYVYKTFGNVKYKIYISLIGRTIDLRAKGSSLCYLPDMFSDLSIYTYSLDMIHGLRFTEIRGYALTNPSFSSPDDSLIKSLKAAVFSAKKEEVLFRIQAREADKIRQEALHE